MEKIWKLLETPSEELEKLKKTGLSEVFCKILYNRNILTRVDFDKYFTPKSRFLFSPFMLKGIPEAVSRIMDAVDREEMMRVYGDRDVDGITSTVLLTETLKGFSKRVDYTVPVIEDGYGLNPDYIDVAKKEGVQLLITVDCGISNYAEVEYAKKCGIDVIITDHHEPLDTVPDAVTVVDPKLNGENLPQNDIAGVGVSFKLSLALEMSKNKKLSKPLVAFDLTDNSIEALAFSPSKGFTSVKKITGNTLNGITPLFFSELERQKIGEIIPEVLNTGDNYESKAVFLMELAENSLSDLSGHSKQEIDEELCIDMASGAKKLLLMYLKCLEASSKEVKALWLRCLDILAIGTIADMVPLKGENRAFAKMGLKFVAKTKRVGLNNLFAMLGWKNKPVTERDVSFSIAPVLNSSGRLKSAELAIELLATTVPGRATKLANELYELNTERKKLGEECYREVKKHLGKQNDLENDKLLMVAAPVSNKGVTGIVATRLMLDYCRPVIVLLEDQGRFLGSARSFNNINIIEALNYCSDLLEKYGGHVGAAGLTMRTENVEAFRAKLREYAQVNVAEEDLIPEWKIDSELNIDDVNDSFLNELLNFAPFGVANPAPLFVANDAKFYEIRKVGDTKAHLRFKFKKSNGKYIFGIGFNMGDLMSPDTIRDGSCDIVFNVEPNDYNGVRSPQLMVRDCRIKGFK